jgi:hypothetical protein
MKEALDRSYQVIGLTARRRALHHPHLLFVQLNATFAVSTEP